MKLIIQWITCAAFLLFFALPCTAKECAWVKAEASYPLVGDISAVEAEKKAIGEAKRKAIEQVGGSLVKSETLVINAETVSDVIMTASVARVVQHHVIESGIKPLAAHKDKPEYVYEVKIDACVLEEEEKPDPYFRIEAKLNRTSFKDEDDVNITVRSLYDQDCHLYLFVLMCDDKVIQLLPNQYKKDNLLKAGATFTYPNKADKASGLGLYACLPRGKARASETLYVLALKKAYDFGTGIAEGIYGIYDGRTAFVEDLGKMIINIPLQDRTVEAISYEIKKQ